MSRSDVELLGRLWAPLEQGDLVELFMDEERARDLQRAIAPYVDPNVEVVFEPPGLLPPQEGVGGLFAGWRLWLEQWASYRVEFDGAFEHGDQVVTLVRQVGRTIHGGVDVPSSPSAAVFTMRDGKIARIAFYLDRTVAARQEGFELP